SDIAFAENGDLLIVNRTSRTVIRLDPPTGTRTNISSSGNFADPTGIARDSNGDLIIGDREALGGAGAIIRVNPYTGVQTVISSNGNFVNPGAVRVAANGDIFVADADAFGGNG